MDFIESPSSISDSSRRSSKNPDLESYKSNDIFQSRKNSFLRSLKASLQKISNDQLITQMFEDPNSAIYIPGRVVEIIQETLEDDRENLIMSLLQQNNEANIDPIELNHFLKTSKNIISSLLNELAQTKRFVNYTFRKEFIDNEIENARMQVNAFVTAALSGRSISNMNSESLQKQVNFISKKFFEIDLPNLRSKYEKEIKEHIENENQQQKMITSLTRQIEKIRKESNLLAEKLSKSEKTVDLLKDKINSLQEVQKQVSVAKNQIKTMQKEVDKKNKAIDFYITEKSNDDSVSLNLSRLQSSYSGLKKKYEELEAENRKLKETLTKTNLSQSEFTHINSIHKADVQSLKTQNARIPQLESDLQKSMRHVKSLEITNIEIAKRLDKSLRENNELYKRIDELKNEISGASTDRSNKAELRSEIELLNEELAAAKKQISDLDNNVFELSQYNQKLKREIDSKSSSLDQSMLDFSSQKSKFQNSLAESETKVNFLTTKLQEYESSIHFNMKQLRQKEIQINELINSKKELEEQATKYKSKLESREAEFQQASISCEQSSEAYQYAQAELRQKESIINKLMQADEISKQQKEKMTEKIEENNLIIQRLNGSIHELSNEKDKMQTEINERENTIFELNGKIKENSDKITEKDNLLNKLNASNQALRKTIKKLEANKSNNEQTISTLREKVASCEKQIERNKESIQILKSENQKQLNEKKDLQKKISDDSIAYEARLSQVEKEKVLLTKKQTETELKLNSSIEECKSLTDKYNKSIEEFDKLKQENTQIQKTSDQVQSNLTEQIKKMRQDNSLMQAKFDNLLQQANEVVKIKKIHDIPGVLKKLKEKYDLLLIDDNKTRKILKINSEFESIPDTIQKIKDDRIRLLKFESKIRKVVGNFDSDFILQTIQNSLEIQNGLSGLFKKQTTPAEYYEIIRISFLKLQEYEERERVLDSLFANKNKSLTVSSNNNNDDDSNLSISGLNDETTNNYSIKSENEVDIIKDLPTYITTMQKMYRDSHHVVKKLYRLFEIRNQDEIPTRVSILLTQIQELKTILNINSNNDSTSNASTNSPNKKEKINYEESVSKAVTDVVDQLKVAKIELRSIYNLFDQSNDVYSYTNQSNDGSKDLPINKQIENMQKENKKLRYILNSASQVISQKEEFDINQIDQTESETSIDLSDSSKSPIKASSSMKNSNSPMKASTLSKKSKSSLKKSSLVLTNSAYLSSPLSRQPIDADFILKCQQLMQKIELLENQQKEIERSLPNIPYNFTHVRSLDETDNNNTNLVLIGSLPDRVRQMANRYSSFYNQVNECQKIFKDANKSYISLNGNLPSAVSMILTRIEEHERQERMIKSILEESSVFSFTGNIQETISELVQKNLDLTLTFQQLNGIVFASKDDVKDNLVITVDKIVKERLEYQKKIDEYTEILSGQNISERMTLLVQNDNFLAKLKQSLECNTNDDLFAKIKNSRVLLKKIVSLIPSNLKLSSSQNNSQSRNKSSKNISSDDMNINESALLEQLGHFQDLYDFRIEIFDRFNSSAQTLQPLDSSISSFELSNSNSNSDSDSNLIASTHRKKINSRMKRLKTQNVSVNQNQFETDQELLQFIDDQSTELLVLKKMKNELESILPRSVEGSVSEKTSQVVKQCLLYQRQYSSLKKLIPPEFHGSLSSKIEKLMDVLKKYQNQQEELTKIVNEDQFSTSETDTESVSDNGSVHNSNQLILKNDDSLVSDVAQIKRKSEEISKDLYIINQLIPEEFVGNSERERIVMLIDEFNKQKLVIQSISSSLDKNASSMINSASGSIEEQVEKAVNKNENLLNEKIEALKLLDSTNSNQELIPLLKKTIKEKKVCQEILSHLMKVLNCSDNEIIERIQELNKHSQLLRNIYQEMTNGNNNVQMKKSDLIKKLKELNENSRVLSLIESTIPEEVKPYNEANSSKAKNLSRLNLLQAKIAVLIDSFKEKHDTIHKLSLNDNLADSVSKLLIEKEELSQALTAVQSILAKSTIKTSFLDDDQSEQNGQDLSIGSRQMIVSQVSNLVNSLQQANSLIAQLNDKLSDFPGDINTKLDEVLRQNFVLQKMQSDLMQLLPDNLSGNLIERVTQMCSEYANLENQQVAISRNIPIEFSSAQNGQSVCERVDSLQQDYSVQRRAIQRIQKMLLQNQYWHRNCTTIDSIADCVEEILNKNSHLIQMQKNINNKFGVFGPTNFDENEIKNESDDFNILLMNSIDETFNTIDKLKAENLELKENMNELREISKHSDLNEFMKKSLKDKKILKRIIEILSPNNNNNNKNGNENSNVAFSLVQETLFELNKFKQEQNEIVSILSDLDETSNFDKSKSNDDSLVNQISFIIKSLSEQEKMINDMNQQIPNEIKGENAFSRLNNLVKKFNEQKSIIRKASNHIENVNNNNDQNEDSQALIDQVQFLTKSNQKLLRERELIIDSLPPSFGQFEYPDSVLNLSSELQKGESFLNSISNSFKEAQDSRPSSPKPVKKLQIFEKDASIGINAFASLPSQVELALEERNDLLKFKLHLSQQLHNEDITEEIDRLMNLDSQLKFVSEKIPKSFEGNGIEKRIQIFNNEYQRKSSLIDKIDDTLPGSGDLVKRAQSLRDEDEEMKRTILQLNHIMLNDLFEGSSLLEKVSNVAKKYQSVNNYLNSSKDKSVDLSEEAMKMSLMNKKNKEKINNISKVLSKNNLLDIDNDENYILEDRIEEICEELIKLRELLQFIDSEASSSTAMKKVIKQKSIMNLPGSNDAAARKVGLLVQTNNQLEQQVNSIKSLLNDHFSDEETVNKTALSIEDQISSIIKENNDLKSHINLIDDVLNKVKGNDILEKLNQLNVELKKTKDRIQNIAKLIPEEFDNSNLESNLLDLVQSYQSNSTYLNNIDRIVADLESDVNLNNNQNSPSSILKSNKSFMRNKINQNIQSKVSKLVQQNQELQELWDKVYKAFPNQFKDKKDLIERINSLIQQQENQLEILKSSELILNAHLKRENNDDLNDNRFSSIPENISNLIDENQRMKSTLEEINVTIPNKLLPNKGNNNSNISGNKESLTNVYSLVRKCSELTNRISQIDQLLFIKNKKENNENDVDNDDDDINSKSIEERITFLFKQLKVSQDNYMKIKKAILLNSKSSNLDEDNPIENLDLILQNKEKMMSFVSHLVNMIPEQFKDGKSDGNIIISDDSNFVSIEKMMSNFVNDFEKQKRMFNQVQSAISSSKSKQNDNNDDDDEDDTEQGIINHIQSVYEEFDKAKQILPSEFKTQNNFTQNFSKFVKTYNSIKSMFNNNNNNNENILNVISNYTQNHQQMVDLLENVNSMISESLNKSGLNSKTNSNSIEKVNENVSQLTKQFEQQNETINSSIKLIKNHIIQLNDQIEKQKFKFTSQNLKEDEVINQNNLNETLEKLLTEKNENFELLSRLSLLIPTQFTESSENKSSFNIEKSMTSFNKAFMKLQKESNKPSQISNDSTSLESSEIEKLQKEREYLYDILDGIQKEIPEEIKNENKKKKKNEEEEEENVEETLSNLLKNVEKLNNRYQKLSSLVKRNEKLDKIEKLLKKQTAQSNELGFEEEEEEVDDENVEEKIVQLLNNQKNNLEFVQNDIKNENFESDQSSKNISNPKKLIKTEKEEEEEEKVEKKEKVIFDFNENENSDDDHHQDEKDLLEIANFLEGSEEDGNDDLNKKNFDDKVSLDENEIKDDDEEKIENLEDVKNSIDKEGEDENDFEINFDNENQYEIDNEEDKNEMEGSGNGILEIGSDFKEEEDN